MSLIARGIEPTNTAGRLRCSTALFQSFGRLTFEQLSSLRHRGAFTTVSQTFTTCCQLAALLEKELQDGENSAESMVEVWYQV